MEQVFVGSTWKIEIVTEFRDLKKTNEDLEWSGVEFAVSSMEYRVC